MALPENNAINQSPLVHTRLHVTHTVTEIRTSSLSYPQQSKKINIISAVRML